MNKLLTRDQFREGVFARDDHKCVFCWNAAVDAHHIIERRLWSDGGYYLDNGISVCKIHHLECESTVISVEQAREAGKIEKVVLPEHMYDDLVYDKWGNIINQDGTRSPGELFWDESVQKILDPEIKKMFKQYVKYPRTYHLPWSENLTDDDRMMPSIEQFLNRRVIMTEKMDGENSTLYADGKTHARSLESRAHWTQDWLKNFWSERFFLLPQGWRICGENLFAEHSIHYSNLKSYFYGFSIWNEENVCLSWDDTVTWFQLLDITWVPIMYDDIWNEEEIRKFGISKEWQKSHEGYLLRDADAFPFSKFRHLVGKFVRKDHVQTVKHWRYGRSDIAQNEMEN